MATIWLPRYNPSTPRSFLLANGEVVAEPALEESGTGRKVRLAGTTKSVYSSQGENLIREGVKKIAAQRETRFWMPVDLDSRAICREAAINKGSGPAYFNPADSGDIKAQAWWSFKHPTMPIEALIVLRWRKLRYAQNSVAVTLVLQRQQTWKVAATTVNDSEFTAFVAEVDDNDDLLKLVGEKSDWTSILGVENGLVESGAVETVGRKAKEVDSLSEIQIPDLRDEKPGWLTLPLNETNVGGRFFSDVAEYQSEAGGIEKVLATYKQLVADLQSVGIVMHPLQENDFYAALRGKQSPVSIGKPLDDDLNPDPNHCLSVHLPSGTFVITCAHANTNRNEIAMSWEESRMRAELTGTKDLLLAYAEEYVRSQHDRRTTTITTKRKRALGAN